MLAVLLLTGLLGGVSDWVPAPEPPTAEAVERALIEEPMELLLFCARSGWVPEGVRPDSIAMALIGSDRETGRTAAWAARTAGFPLETSLTPVLLEFGSTTVVPTLEDVTSAPELLDAVCRRVLHAFAEGGEPDSVTSVVQLMAASWSILPRCSRILALEALGKTGVDITGEIGIEDIVAVGLSPSARYFSEIGIDHSFPMAGEALPLGRIYMASCADSSAAAIMLDDPLWAVRFRAAGNCDPALLEPLLSDTVPYVALTAAELRGSAGFEDGHSTLRELAVIPGPVGHMAASSLGRGDSLLLMELMTDPETGRRAAAQSAWLADSLPVPQTMAAAWMEDPNWIVPVSWAWHLTETGDSLAAEEALLRLLDDPGPYSDPDRVEEYARMLLDDLRGLEGVSEESGEDGAWMEFPLPFDPSLVSADTVALVTDRGTVLIELWNGTAPVTSSAFAYLVRSGFYDGIVFHRVIPGFVAQAGCPDGTGTGGPGFDLPAEPSLRTFSRGTVGMADAGLGTGGSQFFLMLDSHGRLDGRYTAFGRVIDDSMLDRITVGTTISEAYIL